MDALSFLSSLDLMSIVLLFWYTTLFEIPRYVVATLVVPIVMLWRWRRTAVDPDLTLSVILVGHNEEKSLPDCVASLMEQTVQSLCRRMEIVVVDDGSVDRMREVARDLQREGKVDHVLCLEQRSGKSAAGNLAMSVCTGDIVIILDSDTTLDRDALAELVSYFADPKVGAVGGNLGVRNISVSLMTRLQAIEYGIGISLGRCSQDALGMLAVVSGAFGAFRRAALEGVGGQDIEVGEDADLTMKLRRAGWRLRFAPEARGLTNVPETVPAFIAQRLRWDRGLVTIWMRKFRQGMDARQTEFRVLDAVTILDILFFQIFLPLLFPVYLVWLCYYFGWFAVTIIGATLIGYVLLDFLIFIAASVIGIRTPLKLIVYLPLYTFLHVCLARSVRIVAIVQEFFFRSSYRDPYVPRRVMNQAEPV